MNRATHPGLAPASVPRATYRLQFGPTFTLHDAARLVPYLSALQVSHLYASPLLQARSGSTHGYDVTDPTRLNTEIGTPADLEDLSQRLTDAGMSLMLDIVPNHMGVLDADNPWWLDVLESGPASEHAPAFDIEWAPPQRELTGKVQLPILGQTYGEALESGEIVLRFDPAAGSFGLLYHTHRLPLDPRDYAAILRAAPLPAEATADERCAIGSLMERFGTLPARTTTEPDDRLRRQREIRGLKSALAHWCAATPWGPAWIDRCVHLLQGRSGDAQSFDRLDEVLQRQGWRLAHWRAANDQINYRRFFDVNGLAALRMEDDAVFEAAHALILDWVRTGVVSALRIDHPDGMADPAAYFDRLQRRCTEAHQLGGRGDLGTHVVLEKILAADEPWPTAWAAHGDSGYRFANQVNGLFVDARHAQAFQALTEGFVGAALDFDAELDAAKRTVISLSLAADLRQLTEAARAIALTDRHTQDLTRPGLQDAITELAVGFDVYRSYVDAHGANANDRACIERALASARSRIRPSLLPALAFLRSLLLDAPSRGAQATAWVRRFQQFTAPVMAKAMEDTAFYRYHRLVSLNDVGDDPRRFGMAVPEFHAANARRALETPHTLLAGSTHDSKRSEDVRARLDVLSEMPQRWSEALARFRQLAQTQWRIAGQSIGPTPSDELLLYQTLVGIFPANGCDDATLAELRERVCGYMQKAVREAKQASSWLDTDSDYESALRRCTEILLTRLEPNPFLTDLRRLVDQIAPFGCCNSVAATVLKLTSPGVPDLYQGCEDWQFALVDPDNRRPVDFDRLARRLDEVGVLARSPEPTRHLGASPMPGGLHKLFVVSRLLAWRAGMADLLRDGDYVPLEATGPRAAHLVAFARRSAQGCCVVVAARLLWGATGGDLAALVGGRCWEDTAVRLPEELGRFDMGQDVLSGRPMPIRQRSNAVEFAASTLLRDLPVAVIALGAAGLPSQPGPDHPSAGHRTPPHRRAA